MKHETCNIASRENIFYFLFQVSYYMFHEKEVAKITSQIYQERKGSGSSGGFGFKRTGEINF